MVKSKEWRPTTTPCGKSTFFHVLIHTFLLINFNSLVTFCFLFLSFPSSLPTPPPPSPPFSFFPPFLMLSLLSICFQYELEFKCPTYCHFLTTRDNFINQNLGRHYYLPFNLGFNIPPSHVERNKETSHYLPFNLGFNIPPSHVERHKETSHPHTWKNIKRQGKGNSNLWPVKSSFDIILNYQFKKKNLSL